MVVYIKGEYCVNRLICGSVVDAIDVLGWLLFDRERKVIFVQEMRSILYKLCSNATRLLLLGSIRRRRMSCVPE